MSKRLQVMLAIKALVTSALPLVAIRGFDLDLAQPERPAPGGTLTGQPGNPGEPEIDLSPLAYNYEHPFPMELLAPEGVDDPASWIDGNLRLIGEAVLADRTLGGLCQFLDVTAPEEQAFAPPNAAEQRFANFNIVASYATANPLT